MKVIALDLDGTLLRPDGSLGERSAAAVRAAAADGREVVYVTARHLAALRRIADVIDVAAGAICCVGAATYRLPDAVVEDERAIDARSVRQVATRLRARCPDTAFGWVVGERTFLQSRYPDPVRGAELVAADELPAGPVHKLFARSAASPFRSAAAEAAAGTADVAHQTDGFADFVAPGVDKVTALERWCRRRGFAAADVVAFGDTAADTAMLRWAGWGVAVGNAEPAVLAAADEVIGHCAEESVAGWLTATA